MVPISEEHQHGSEPRRRWRPTGRMVVAFGLGECLAFVGVTVLLTLLAGTPDETDAIVYVLGFIVLPLAFVAWVVVLIVLGYSWFVGRSNDAAQAGHDRPALPASLAGDGAPDRELAAEIRRWRQGHGGPTKPVPRN